MNIDTTNAPNTTETAIGFIPCYRLPFLRQKDVEIWNESNLETMKNMPDNHIDLTVTSPPYNLGVKHHTGNNIFKAYDEYIDDMPEDEYQQQQVKVLNEIYRATKEGGSLMYNHKNRIKNGKS